jgi:hypothetical protein
MNDLPKTKDASHRHAVHASGRGPVHAAGAPARPGDKAPAKHERTAPPGRRPDRTGAVVAAGVALLALIGVGTIFSDPIRAALAPPPSTASGAEVVTPAPAAPTPPPAAPAAPPAPAAAAPIAPPPPAPAAGAAAP